MTLFRSGLVLLALVGTAAPFLLAQYLLGRFYSSSVTGLPVPLIPSLGLYSAAFLVAGTIVYFCYKAILKDREPTDQADGLENEEDLPT